MKTFKIFILDHRSIYINSLGDVLAQLGNKIYYQSSWNMQEIEAGIAYFKPEILLTIGCDIPLRHPDLNAIPDICRKHGLFHVYWATEDKIHHHLWSIPFIQRIKPDLIWTLHPDCINSYESLNIQANLLDFSFNPRLFPPKPKNIEEKYDITLVGTTHLHVPTYRIESFKQLLVPLIEAGYKVNIWGFGWSEDVASIKKYLGITIPVDYIHGYLPYKKTIDIYHRSKIVLGVQNAEDQVSQRTYEILGSGTCMIASRTSALEKMFFDRVNILLTDRPSETLDLVRYYLSHKEQRELIEQKARESVISSYTYSHHLPKLWPQLTSLIGNKQ